MTADNSLIAGSKQGESSLIDLKASLFCVKLTYLNTCGSSVSYTSLKKLINISLNFLFSNDAVWHFDGNFVSDSKHILHLQTLNIYHMF